MASSQSADHSSADELEDEPTGLHDEHWPGMHELHEQHDQPQHVSPSMGSTPGSTQQPKPPLPVQKRRRVTRACDECRRKKIKCDGKQPCTHCTVYSYDCTYDQPSNRRRNPAPQYIEALEARLHRAEALLKTVLPDIDLNDPNLDLTTPQRILPTFPRHVTSATGAKQNSHVASESTTNVNGGGESGDESLLESMVDNTGTLDLDDQGYWDYHGQSSGLIFLRRMRQQFGDLFGQELYRGSTPLLRPRPMGHFLDSPRSFDSPQESPSHTSDLPPKAVCKELCSNAVDDACSMMRIVHQPSFYAMLDRIYDTQADQYGNEENRFLPLLYVVMALGCLFAKTEQSKLDLKDGYEGATDQGFQYFRAGRQMMDITDCRDLTSLQAIVFMILFLQSSARLSTCYSYIGVALRSSLRMGLHRTVGIKFDPIEKETRKRVFWVIRRMDIYVGALLGLPQMLSNEDIDQEEPIEVDDEFITADEIKPMPPGKISYMAGSNAHTRLVQILQKIVRYIYPIKGNQGPDKEQSYVVSHAKIREIERDLQVWKENLPMALRPGDEAPKEFIRLQHLLRMSYAHVQMMLYRPFLHYVANACVMRTVDKRSYACAAACVSVSRNIVHITSEMCRRGLLIGSYWFTMYTTFFAILSLVFFVLENPDSDAGEEVFKDAIEGKDVLATLAKKSMAADRCSQTLTGLFADLPDQIVNRERKTSTLTKKKRAAPSPGPPISMAARSNPDVSRVSQSETFPGPQRASTFPTHSQTGTPKRRSVNKLNLPGTSVDDNNVYLSGSRESWTPSESTVFTPESVPNVMLGSQPHTSTASPQTAGVNHAISNVGFPDLSSLMFPSGDPFNYPNQPISMLEDGSFKPENGQFPGMGPNGSSLFFNEPPSATSVNFESFDAPIYSGGTAPYMMQQPHRPPSDDMHPHNFQSQAGWAASNDVGAQVGGGSWPTKTLAHGLPANMNLNEIPGSEEWSTGWMDMGSFR